MLAGGSGITPMFQVAMNPELYIAIDHATKHFVFKWSMILFLFLLPQVARAILENPNDNTKVHLIYANVTYEDILLKVEFSIAMVVMQSI